MVILNTALIVIRLRVYGSLNNWSGKIYAAADLAEEERERNFVFVNLCL